MNSSQTARRTELSATFEVLIRRLASITADATGVIPWSSPVPSFGDPSRAIVATLGLNPSNREFVDGGGAELAGEERRFHTLSSLGLKRWSDAEAAHVQQIAEYCWTYFSRNPYDTWFRQLDAIIAGTRHSYYEEAAHACHLDLVPYATSSKWTGLSRAQRLALLRVAGDTLALLLRDSPIRVLVLNGASVVQNFSDLANVALAERRMMGWSLRRVGSPDVSGIAYAGTIDEVLGVKLGRRVTILGFNHNLQSSFGVTREVRASIARWITRRSSECLPA
jgi:hypothetical protein